MVKNCSMCDSDFECTRSDAKYCSSFCRTLWSKVNRQAITFGPQVEPGRRVCRGCSQLLRDSDFGRVQSEKRLSIYNSGTFQQHCKSCTRAKQKAYYREKRGLPLHGPTPPRGKPIGSTHTHRGYVMQKVGPGGHPRADRSGYVFQHILVAEEKYGIPITRDFTIHHRNGNRSDNSPANLELRVGNHGKCADVAPALIANEEVLSLILEHLSELGYTVIPPEGDPHEHHA